jgi:hypothetical protein
MLHASNCSKQHLELIGICEPYLPNEKVFGNKIMAKGFFSIEKNIEYTQHM